MVFTLFKRIGKWLRGESEDTCSSIPDPINGASNLSYHVKTTGLNGKTRKVLIDSIEEADRKKLITRDEKESLKGISLLRAQYDRGKEGRLKRYAEKGRIKDVSFKSYLEACLLRARIFGNHLEGYVDVPLTYRNRDDAMKKYSVRINYNVLEKYFGISETRLNDLEKKAKINRNLREIDKKHRLRDSSLREFERAEKRYPGKDIIGKLGWAPQTA